MTAEQLESSETKTRIIEAARTLFAKHGFAATSVRDIAKTSNVNLAAINYHFKNKENLFWEIISSSHDRGEEICKQISETAKNLEEFSLRVYDHFYENKELMRNTMAMMLSDSLNPPEGTPFCRKMAESDTFGPPGGNYFAQFLVKEIPYPLKPEAILWGVKSIFGTIVHWTTMCTTLQFKALAEKSPLMTPEKIRSDVALMIKSTLQFMKSNPEYFKK